MAARNLRQQSELLRVQAVDLRQKAARIKAVSKRTQARLKK